MRRCWMLARMSAASLTRRKSRVAIVLAALVLGTTIISGLVSVYYDIGQKMSRELRTYGANLVIAPASPENWPYVRLEDTEDIATRVESSRLVGYAPYLYGVARLRSHDIVVVGTRFGDVEKVSPFWRITGSTALADLGGDSALVGQGIATRLKIGLGDRIELARIDSSDTREAVVRGILGTGSREDFQIVLDLDFAADLLGQREVSSAAHYSIVGSTQDLESFAEAVRSEFPGVTAHPIKRISKSEGQVLEKIKALVFLAVALILVLTILCVAITMTNVASERRREVALRKALGAQDRDITLEFLAEGGGLGLVGGVLGWALGLPFAQAVGQSVFQSAVSPRPEVLPLAVLLSGFLAALASILPARAAARVEPATILKGE